jgi:hypothetical protein
MAEALSLVASGAGFASLAIQLGNILIRLKDLWAKIKTSKDEIRYFIEEIETLSILLSEIRDGSNDEDMTSQAAATEKSLALCQRGVTILSEVLIDLDKQISRRRLVGGLKATMKSSTIAQLRDRLSKAQLLLVLSYQIYSE